VRGREIHVHDFVVAERLAIRTEPPIANTTLRERHRLMRNVTPPTLAEVIDLRLRAPGSLESAAASINRHIDLYLRADAGGQAHRVRAGFELIAVRKRIPHGQWETWCADNIHRSMRDIQRLMKMAGADDPEAAAEEERSVRREGMASNRAKATHVGRFCSSVERVFQLFLQLNETERAEFLDLVAKESGG
jgi:hypothetical protein